MKLFPEDLLYSQEHLWIRAEGNLATIGITDHAQEKLGEILSLDLPEADSCVERDEPFGRIESAKAGGGHDNITVVLAEVRATP